MSDDEPGDAEIIEELQVGPANPEDECKCGSEQCRQLELSRELDLIFDPALVYRSATQLDRIWPLLTNRQVEVSSFLALLAEYKAERHCGTAWPQDFVAYRCRTCSKSPNMAICADCFKNGNHEGHDYNMFKSSSGGACDCGFDIVKESGHCSRHGLNATAQRANEPIPESLICVPRRAMPRIIHRLAIQLRKSSNDIGTYADFLMQLAKHGAVMRGLMIEALISEEVYSSQIQVLSNQVGNKQSAKIFKDGLKYLKHERRCLTPFKVPQEWKPPSPDINAFCDNIPITCFIDELVFWMIVYELPEKLVCFLLGFLMDVKYRQRFARSFVRNYPRILLILVGVRGEPSRHLTRESFDKLSRRISHVSVQLYCHPDLTKELCDEEYVLHTIIYCLRAAIEGTPSDSGVLEPNRLCPPTKHMPMVVNTEGALIRDRHLRSFTGDLNNILACENEVYRLLQDNDLLNTWLELLCNFQTMNPYKRELTEHTPYETGPHMSVFAVEADFCLSPLWSLLKYLKSDLTVPSSQSLLAALHKNLSRWFYSMGIGPNSLLDPYDMSFHIPLHRMFAATLRNMMFTQNMNDQDLHRFIMCNQASLGTQYSYRSASGIKTPITFSGFIKMLLLHPLQALTLYNQIRNTMWTRNGISIINQAITYVHCACSYSTIDLDMFLLKYAASKSNPNYFIRTLLSRFHSWKWLSFKSNLLVNDSLDEVRQLYHFNILPDQVTLMIESSLVTLIQIVTLSIYCNISEKEQTRQEMVALISVIDRSYSYLLDMLPDRGVTNFGSADQNFVSLLEELTIYKPAQHGVGGNLQQGSYALKPEVWDKEYNPIQVLYRFYQKRDYQMSLERFFQHAKLTGKLDRRFHPSTLWPPLKIPQNLGALAPPPAHLNLNSLLECQTLVGLVFTIIHKNLYYADVPDAIMAYTIHLLELSIRQCVASSSDSREKRKEQQSLDPTFKGRYSLKELSSCPAYFGSKDETNVKGNTLFSVPHDEPGFKESGGRPSCEDVDDDRLFPVVKNALDLAFDSTWFPFNSVLENCLVHIENVHLLPWREFETLLETQRDPSSRPDRVKSAEQARGSDAEMSSSEQECDDMGIEEMIDDIDADDDLERDDNDDDVDEDDDGDGDDDDGDDDDDDNDDDSEVGMGVDSGDENGEHQGSGTVRITSFHADSDPDESESTIEGTRQAHHRPVAESNRQPAGNSSAADDTWSPFHRANPHTFDRATNTQSSWGSGGGIGTNAQLTDGGGSSTSIDLTATPTTIELTTPRSDASAHDGGASSSAQLGANSSQTLSLPSTESGSQDERRLTTAVGGGGGGGSTNDEQQRTVAAITGRTPASNRAMLLLRFEDLLNDVEMSVASVANQISMNVDEQAGAQELIPADQAGGASVPMETDTVHREGEPDNGRTAERTLMVADSLPESQSSALSLIPIRGQNFSAASRPERSLQIYPENLVVTSPRRPGPIRPVGRPTLAHAVDSPQPLALEAPRTSGSEASSGGSSSGGGGGGSGGVSSATSQVGGVNTNRGERSLSEMDIHARFVGFFQQRQESHRSQQRGYRQRQMARRGGFRGPVIPLAMHNPNNNNNNNNSQTTAYVTHPLDGGALNNNNNNSNNNNNNNNISDNNNGGEQTSAGVVAVATATAAEAAVAAAAALPRGEELNSPSRDPRMAAAARRSTAQCSCTLLNRALSSRLQQDLRQRRLRRDRMHHGESLLSLLLRLHAKYSHRANSYEYNEIRALANLSPDRTRIGDGVHFVTIVLDLICQSNQKMRARLVQLQKLIWASNEQAAAAAATMAATSSAANASDITKMQLGEEEEQPQRQPAGGLAGGVKSEQNPDDGESSSSRGGGGGGGAKAEQGGGAAGLGQPSLAGSSKVIPSSSLDPSERRRRAKEFQSKLMAQFANKQRAFIEKYESSQSEAGASGSGAGGGRKSDKIELGPDEEPINLSQKMSPETRPQMSEPDKQRQQQQQGRRASATSAAGQPPEEEEEEPRRKQELTPADNSGSGDGAVGSKLKADGRGGGPEQRPASSGDSAGRATTTTTTTSSTTDTSGGAGERPTYECCICGSDSASGDLANPLGQVVLLQATSVYGHAHLRARRERKLPCDDAEQLQLQEETYAKYLARRIDLMCEHFCESSRLDSINIGAEGGVHVQSCGHYLHIQCHQSYIKSLDQEDRPRARNDTDEFLCPVCRQLANSVLPILARPSQFSSSTMSSELAAAAAASEEASREGGGQGRASMGAGVVALNLEQQIRLIGSLLEHRSAPNQRELQSSASFCQHLTKATGAEYRRVKSEPNMHSLFLFLTSIARTNLETEVIMRSSRRRNSNVGGAAAATSSSAPCESGVGVGPRRSCFLLLFQVLALNSRTLIEDHWFTYDQLWAHLTHRADEKNRLSVKPMKKSEVPLLLRDPTAMLLQFLFAITDPKDLSYQATHFTCLVQMLFNLTVIQSIALVLSYIKPEAQARLVEAAAAAAAAAAPGGFKPTEHGSATATAAAAAGTNESSQLPNVSPSYDKPIRDANRAAGSANQFSHLLALVGVCLRPLLLPANEEPLLDLRVRSGWPEQLNMGDETTAASLEQGLCLAENRTKLACLSFLRVAALIQHHLFGQPMPDLESLDDQLLVDAPTIESDFSKLIAYLRLGGGHSHGGQSGSPHSAAFSGSPFSENQAAAAAKPATAVAVAAQTPPQPPLLTCRPTDRRLLMDALNWPPGARESLVSGWSAELLRFGAEFSIAARSLLVCRPLAWHKPSLMQLPDSFDDIFLFYYRKECSLCHQVPKDVAICLVCGAPVCFRNGCCKARSGSRQLHSQHCGASTAIFLAVQTSSIVVIRGNRACVWGSVYLDAHDEEDSGLQRGKPLHLVQARFKLLEEQWLTHTFDHTCGKRWIYLQES